MNFIVIIAVLVSVIVYLYAGFFWNRKIKNVGDLFPLIKNTQAQVKNQKEFSSATVAATISLTTLIIAYFELAPEYGLFWLMWTVITTASGIFIVRVFAKKIWTKFSTYNYRPTLHSFLGNEYNSDNLALIAAICTSIGYLGVIATELTVGSKFITGLITGIPQWVGVIILSGIGLIYTAAGGFRVVIVTDRIQMWSIWLLILVLSGFYIYYIGGIEHWHIDFSKMPRDILNLNPRDGIGSFLIGIFLINVPFYLGDMSIYQRISGAQKSETVFKGLWKSVLNSALSWTFLLLLAVFVFLIITPKNNENSLITLLNMLGTQFGLGGKIILFLSLIGLVGAMLSVSSTQLIAVSHALYEDIISRFRKPMLSERVNSARELKYSRTILVISCIMAIGIVELLGYLGFSIIDLIFSIYGSQLSLTPLVIIALFSRKRNTKLLSKWGITAVCMGFISGWSSAILGTIKHNADLVSLSPAFSIGVSFLILFIGFIFTPKQNEYMLKK